MSGLFTLTSGDILKDVCPSHLSDLLLLQVVPLIHHFALEGAAVSVVENPLLGQEVGLLLGLGMLHVLLVLGQTLLLLLLGCAVVLIHLLRREQSRNTSSSSNSDWHILAGQFISCETSIYPCEYWLNWSN